MTTGKCEDDWIQCGAPGGQARSHAPEIPKWGEEAAARRAGFDCRVWRHWPMVG
jgi:hypothetical protein